MKTAIRRSPRLAPTRSCQLPPNRSGGVGIVGELAANDTSAGAASGLLEFSCDDRYGVAVGVEDVAFVTTAAEGARGIYLAAGIEQQGLVAEDDDE